MRVAIASDHRGFHLKEKVITLLKAKGHEVLDDGPSNESSVDYPDFAALVAKKVSGGTAERGILICGTGIGVSISANKVPGIRAALTHDTYSAERAAKSNNAQIITMGARVIGPELAKAIVDKWLDSAFDPKGPSAGNVEAIDRLDAGK